MAGERRQYRARGDAITFVRKIEGLEFADAVVGGAIPLLIVVGAWFLVMRQMQSGGSAALWCVWYIASSASMSAASLISPM